MHGGCYKFSETETKNAWHTHTLPFDQYHVIILVTRRIRFDAMRYRNEKKKKSDQNRRDHQMPVISYRRFCTIYWSLKCIFQFDRHLLSYSFQELVAEKKNPSTKPQCHFVRYRRARIAAVSNRVSPAAIPQQQPLFLTLFTCHRKHVKIKRADRFMIFGK